MLFLSRVFIGMVLGIASITPGVSGGVIAAAIGIYEPAVNAISNLRKDLKKNILFLMPLGIGAGIGVLLFSNIIKYLYAKWPNEILYLFFGLVAGSIPSVLRVANEKGFKARHLIASVITLGIVLVFAFMEGNTGSGQGMRLGWDFASAMFYGIVLAVGTIIPGISTSFILIYFGAYHELLSAIASMDIVKLIPVGLGALIGVLPLIKFAEIMFKRFRAVSYYGVLGFLVGSMIAVFPGFSNGWMLLIDLLLFLAGIAVSLALLNLNKDNNHNPV